MKISHLIFLGFVSILVMFTITTVVNHRQAEKVNENSRWFAQSTTVMRQSHRFQRNIVNMVSSLRGYLLSGENQFIQSYDSTVQENIEILHQLNEIVDDTSRHKSILREIMILNDRWINDYATPLITARQNAVLSDSSMRRYNALYREKLGSGVEKDLQRQLQAQFRNFTEHEYRLREVRSSVMSRSVRQTRAISYWLTTSAVALGFFISLYLAYRISSRIMEMVRMANTIASGNFSIKTREHGNDELGQLAQSLNHMAEVLSENIRLLERKNHELDQFAHIVSHDLKAPLRGIANVVNWIEEDHADEVSPKVHEYLSLIKGRLQRAENLIGAILLYARIGKQPMESEVTDLNELIAEAVDSLVVPPGIRLEVQRDLPKIRTEKIPLQQVLSNLIGNAIKYHDKPDGYVKVSLRDTGNDYIEFFVEDNGPGIADVYHEKIFAIFQTLQERDSFESTGIGLAIVKKILDDRKQSISVISRPGEGTTFSFTWLK